MEWCKCYCDSSDDWLGDGQACCHGTKEIEICHCGGDKSKCDFYPEYRKENKNTMKYDIKIGDYVETIAGIMGYVNRIDEHNIYWIVTNRNNLDDACDIGTETHTPIDEIEFWSRRVGKYDFRPTETKKNVIEPLEDRGTAYMNYSTAELYRVYNKVNEIIKLINEKEKSDSDA
jgi:hypothetical protein